MRVETQRLLSAKIADSRRCRILMVSQNIGIFSTRG